MALENYRITEFQEKTQVDNGDYVLIDSATDGTHKYQLSRIPAQASAEVAAAVAAEKTAREAADAAEVTARNAAIGAAISDEVTARNAAIAANVDNTLAVSGKAADAKKTGDETANIKSDLEELGLEQVTFATLSSSDLENGALNSDGMNTGSLAYRVRTTGYIVLPQSDSIYIAVTSDEDISLCAVQYAVNDFSTPKLKYGAWQKPGRVDLVDGANYLRLVFSINGMTANISPSDIDSVDLYTIKASVVKTTAQTLTDAEKAQARTNIGAMAEGGGDYDEIVAYAKNIGLRVLDALDKIIWEDSSGTAEINALRAAVYDVPDPSHVLPAGYTRYDYIEKYQGTVRNTYPLIRIKEYPNIYEKGIDITFGYSSLAGSTIALLGARNRSSSVTDNSRSFAFYSNKTGVFMHLYGSQTTITSSGVTESNNLIQYRPNSNGAVVTVNGVDVTVTGSYSSALSLLGLGVSANPVTYTDDSQATNASITGGARIGNIKIYDGSVLIGNYVPCLRIADNVIGMYDTIENVFYTAERLSYATPGNADCMWRAGEW